jgi:hypothetical protein
MVWCAADALLLLCVLCDRDEEVYDTNRNFVERVCVGGMIWPVAFQLQKSDEICITFNKWPIFISVSAF